MVAAATEARLDNTGQSCNGAKRFIVVDGLYEAFLTKFTSAMAAAPVGDPLVEETVLGPMSSVAAATRLQDQRQPQLQSERRGWQNPINTAAMPNSYTGKGGSKRD